MNYCEISQQLKDRGQEQLLRFYDRLTAEEQVCLLDQIQTIDWTMLQRSHEQAPSGEITPMKGLSVGEIERNRSLYEEEGKRFIREGKVAALLLAGGQGTRLGSDAPKGAYNIGVTRPLYIFECLIRNLQEVCASCGAYVPLYIMTSDKNDAETRAFFKEHAYFGYPEQCVRFFKQDMAVCTDFEGKILLEEEGKIAVSPNGNGGCFSSMKNAGLFEEAKKQGVEWFNVFAVDNVLQRIADPVFLGATVLSGAACGAKFVRKCSPEERVGVLCFRGGAPDVIEYYELPKELACALDQSGELLYSFGVTLNYLFRADRLEEIIGSKIPVHTAKKKIPYINERGEKIVPTTENGYKYETLIVDMVRLAGTCLPFEVIREREFAPVKNQEGVDSVESARILLQQNGVVL